MLHILEGGQVIHSFIYPFIHCFTLCVCHAASPPPANHQPPATIMRFSKIFRRSKKSTSESSHKYKSSKTTPEDIERALYRKYNSRYDRYSHPALDERGSYAPWIQLPESILDRVFSFVCPHATDDTYETCELSALADACMLCDLRDLAHAGQVCKKWHKSARKLM